MARPYCCFFDPEKSYEDRELSDPCPACGRRYDFPLEEPPTTIGDYRVVRPLYRGFYGVVYVTEFGRLGQRFVVKVVPKRVYDVFGKNFEEECRLHAEVAADVEHVVPIVNFDDMDVAFGPLELPCYVAVMQYVDGPTMAEFAETASAASLAQIAIDLFRLLQELENKQRYHNDLHDLNIIIQQLSAGARRADAVDETIRAVAVDLGSIADRSKSADRLNDLHAIASHLFTFVDRLLADPDEASDTDYRLAAALEEIGQMMRPEALKQRTPDFGHFIDLIRDAVLHSSSPWRAPDRLRRFNDAYNAQTLHWGFVPRLLVDPDNQWVPAVSTPGPQIITGMRGCGKTMLLRALQFHARAAEADGAKGRDELVQNLEQDGFVALYVSCTRLLDKLGAQTEKLNEPYARLYLAYAREAVRAARHLREIDRTLVVPGYHRGLAQAVADYVGNGEFIAEAATEIDLERRLQRMLRSLERGETDFSLEANPSVAFPHLAEAVRICSPPWRGAVVLFLLDDVSTRHLDKAAIRELLSTLLFQSEVCAFKMTTEAQTLADLRSPGLIEKARPGRDYETFDLGAAVNERLRPPGGKEFIASILDQRAKQFAAHPVMKPASLLGDVALEQIGREIRSIPRRVRLKSKNAGKSERGKKTIYRGISALAAVCVGDIGDVISIYDAMLRETNRRGASRIEPEVQSSCYQDYCSRRLYHLNRREGRLKDFALSFAEAAHELLMRSKPERLRQYTKVYVRLTTGDTAAQFEQIRELIDSGVFVLEGGTETPRTKTRDSDPMQQFVLTYRKLFGLSNFIGLSDRDRFELSGSDLEDWLNEPERGREILLRHLGGAGSQQDTSVVATAEAKVETSPSEMPAADPAEIPRAPSLFDSGTWGGDERETTHEDASPPLTITRVPRPCALATDELREIGIDALVVGLGFEDRTLASVERVLAATEPKHARLIRYQDPGLGVEIERLVRKRVDDVAIVDYDVARQNGLQAPLGGKMLIDVTGLAKPVLFHAVRNSLRSESRVWIAHTMAKRHYPLSEEIQKVLEAERDQDPYALLAALDQVWSGEEGPYEFDKLLATESDESRRRLLLASVSPKHQRLLSLLDERDYDRIDILAPDAQTPRGELARLAADVACRGVEASEIAELDSNDLGGALQLIAEHYQRWYVGGGYDFEFGLTGSKLHAVAFAAVSAALKIAQCWYVRPRSFDPARFTEGVDETEYFEIQMPQ